ncbi:MAG: hypothetical protein DRM98_04160, partial [Thermoplasmata archaeon]
MEIEIDSKKNNPLLNRTEVYFTVKHKGEGTPSRELIRSELADKLNAKKENIIVHVMTSSFGSQETSGYAKVYSSVEKSKNYEGEHILKRNKIIAEKKEVKPEEKPPVTEAPVESSAEQPSASSEEKPAEAAPPSVEPAGEQQPAEQPEADKSSVEA